MLTSALTAFLIIIHIYAYPQASDLIHVQKKNGHILKTFIAGSPIIFETKYGTFINGRVKVIRNDSLFVTTYDTRTVIAQLGFILVDTVATYTDGFYYKDILRIKIFRRQRFIRGKIDRLLMYGGAGYFCLNIFNGLYLKQSLTEEGNLKKLALSTGAFEVGLLIKKCFYVNRFSRRWHKIVYVNVR